MIQLFHEEKENFINDLLKLWEEKRENFPSKTPLGDILAKYLNGKIKINESKGIRDSKSKIKISIFRKI